MPQAGSRDQVIPRQPHASFCLLGLLA